MASSTELHTMIAKAAGSKTFRAALVNDPSSAAAEIGISLDDDQLSAFEAAKDKIANSTLDLKISDTQAALLAVWI